MKPIISYVRIAKKHENLNENACSRWLCNCVETGWHSIRGMLGYGEQLADETHSKRVSSGCGKQLTDEALSKRVSSGCGKQLANEPHSKRVSSGYCEQLADEPHSKRVSSGRWRPTGKTPRISGK